MKAHEKIFIKMKKYNGLAAVMVFVLVLSACAGGAAVEQPEADIDFISTQVAATMMAGGNQAVEATLVPTNEMSAPASEPAPEVTFICEECVNDDGSIIAISLWQNPDPDNSPPGGYVSHGDKCLLLDEVTNSEGIDRVLLDCPGGKGWVRKEGISYGW